MTEQLQVRRLVDGDAEASRTLGQEAFGTPPTPPTDPARLDEVGRRYFGAFAADTLAARLSVRDYHSWFGGREVATAGIASVTVGLEHRGRGALGPLLTAALAQARADGAAISTLFPSAPGIYRRFGYELVSDYRTVQLPSGELARTPAPTTPVALRRAEPADAPAIEQLYTAWASAQNGPLSRRGPSFPPERGYLDDFDAVTLALDADQAVVGFTSWDRGQGYGPSATLEVSDLLAVTADAHRALLRGIGTFATITGQTRIDTSGDDLARLFLPSMVWETAKSDPYMLAVLDVVRAIEGRGYPPPSSVDVAFELRGHVLTDVDGGYRVQVADGRARCERGATAAGAPVIHARGMSLLYAGVQSAANLRFAGLLQGGTPAVDAALDLLFAGRPFHIRNYF